MDVDLSTGSASGSFLNCVFWSAAIFGLLYFVRRFIKGAQFSERISAEGKVAVVTGGNSGIGFETVRELNIRKAKVYMLCRSEERADEAKRNLVRLGCNPTRLIFIQCDLANFSSVRSAAEKLLKSEPKIDILINNAGIMFQSKYEKTVDGHEMTWQSNHLGPFLLTNLLLPALKNADRARIVNVSSMLHKNSKRLDFATIDDKKSYGLFGPYNRSKLANVMHARALTNVLRKEGTHNVSANSVHPGVVDTGLARKTWLLATPLREIFWPFRWFFLKTNKDGAQTSLYVALSKKLEGVSGKYFSDCQLREESELARDDQACEDLYNYSLEQTR
ncbi:unnamed protein product [Caenorhabditis auriculariae]|uniref:Uncharacterized protein n=1 Tax=Caenorhabditis auriculariae TaxID=2777116 RepID=A0A8S1HNC5_9PELO|nr:unnamed protein product [Caenorhabditis auriculariae]